LNDQPEIQARLYSAIGEVYLDLGEFKKSKLMIEPALALDESLFGQQHWRTLKDRTLLGLS
jgi:hypothetical protein